MPLDPETVPDDGNDEIDGEDVDTGDVEDVTEDTDNDQVVSEEASFDAAH